MVARNFLQFSTIIGLRGFYFPLILTKAFINADLYGVEA